MARTPKEPKTFCRKQNEENRDDGNQTDVTRFDDLAIRDPDAPVWSLNDFDIGKLLGVGQFGSVFLARERRSKFVVALKAIKKSSLIRQSNEYLLRREIEIHSHLLHKHILQFYGWFCTEKRIYLILEIAPKGELMDQLLEGGFKEEKVSKYMFQMISAVRCCHRMNVMHRDLKPENILVDLDGNLKLADFGWAAHVDPAAAERNAAKTTNDSVSSSNPNFKYLSTRRKTFCGTLDYLSPEICRHEWYGKAVDVWCLGVFCYELATGGPPFSHMSYMKEHNLEENEARKKQQEDIQKADLEPKLTDDMSPSLKDFLRKALAKNAEDRLDPWGMLQHEFIRKYNDISEELDDELRDRGYINPDPETIDQVLHLPSPKPMMGLSGKSSTGMTPAWATSRLYLSAASSPNSGLFSKELPSPYRCAETAAPHMTLEPISETRKKSSKIKSEKITRRSKTVTPIPRTIEILAEDERTI